MPATCYNRPPMPPDASSPALLDFPPTHAGARIGLLGGTFDPPHLGHLQLSQVALTKLKLDRVWWLISPGNPLKPDSPTLTMAQRLERAHELIARQRISASAAEEKLTSAYTYDTIRTVRDRYPKVHFVWLMGLDNLAQFHLWHRWQDIAAAVPIAVFNRPGIEFSEEWPAVRAMAAARRDARAAKSLAAMPPPAWVFLPLPRVDLSSTAIRARRGLAATS